MRTKSSLKRCINAFGSVKGYYAPVDDRCPRPADRDLSIPRSRVGTSKTLPILLRIQQSRDSLNISSTGIYPLNRLVHQSALNWIVLSIPRSRVGSRGQSANASEWAIHKLPLQISLRLVPRNFVHGYCLLRQLE